MQRTDDGITMICRRNNINYNPNGGVMSTHTTDDGIISLTFRGSAVCSLQSIRFQDAYSTCCVAQKTLSSERKKRERTRIVIWTVLYQRKNRARTTNAAKKHISYVTWLSTFLYSEPISSSPNRLMRFHAYIGIFVHSHAYTNPFNDEKRANESQRKKDSNSPQ